MKAGFHRMGVMSDLENNFIAVDTTKEKDCFVSKKQILKVRGYKLLHSDEFTIVPLVPCVMPELKIGNYITKINGHKIPDGDFKFTIKNIKYKKLRWWEFWKNWKFWRHKRVVESYTVKVV